MENDVIVEELKSESESEIIKFKVSEVLEKILKEEIEIGLFRRFCWNKRYIKDYVLTIWFSKLGLEKYRMVMVRGLNNKYIVADGYQRLISIIAYVYNSEYFKTLLNKYVGEVNFKKFKFLDYIEKFLKDNKYRFSSNVNSCHVNLDIKSLGYLNVGFDKLSIEEKRDFLDTELYFDIINCPENKDAKFVAGRLFLYINS